MNPRQIKIRYTPAFLKSLRKFPKGKLKFLAEKEKIFRENPYDARLKTHKLKGELTESLLRSDLGVRSDLSGRGEDTVIFDAIGTHEVYICSQNTPPKIEYLGGDECSKANTHFRGIKAKMLDYSASSCKLKNTIPRAFSPRKFITNAVA